MSKPRKQPHRTRGALDDGVQVAVQLEAEDLAAVRTISQRTRSSISAVIRAAVTHYLHTVGA